jgi:hypothetical protein
MYAKSHEISSLLLKLTSAKINVAEIMTTLVDKCKIKESISLKTLILVVKILIE